MAGKSTAISAPKTSRKLEIAKQGYQKITDDKVREILGYMEQGLTERKSCELAEVNRSTFRQRVARFEAATHYAQSLATLAESKIEAIDSAVDMLLRGEIDPATARVVIDTYKWEASKLLPKKYGDKLDLTSDGKALPQPLLGGVTIEPTKELPENA